MVAAIFAVFKIQVEMAVKHAVVDLFCGIGGLSHGFRKEKFKVVAGIDFDESCKYAFEKNNKANFYCEDLSVVDSQKISDLFPEGKTKILVGCAPCQAFSTLSQKYKDNDKWKMLYSFGRIIESVQPEIVSMENVPNLRNYRGGKVLDDFLKTLKNNQYYVTWKIVDSSEYGVPQRRRRLVLLASKLGQIDFIKPTFLKNKVTVREAIEHLPAIEDGQSAKDDRLHRSRKLSPLNKKRIESTPRGGGWKDWPSELVLECHKKESGKTFGSVYGRMNWDDVAPTMTTQCTGLGNGRFGHPEQDRAISLREAALIQSFPSEYEFYDPNGEFSTPKIEMHIGNAVPVKLGQVIARSIRKHLKQYR